MEVEKTAEGAAARLSKSILARYHEEQIWSDKIRRMSTWGTWGLMGVNVLLFLVFQIAVEPWRRKRLVRGFEEKVMEALEKEGLVHNPNLKGQQTAEDVAIERPITSDIAAEVGGNAATGALVLDSSLEAAMKEGRNGTIAADVPSGGAASPSTSTLTIFGLIQGKARDLFSNRRISLRQIDLTTAALEGAAAGIAVTGLVLLLRPRWTP